MIPFAETPQGRGLMRQIEATNSNWKHVELMAVYRKARDYYEQHNGVPPGQQHDDLQSTNEEISMSIEQHLSDLTAAVKELTAKISGASVAATGKADTTAEPTKAKPGPKPGASKPAAAKPKYSREDMVAVLGEVKEKFDTAAARECFAPTEKMKDIPDADIDKVYLAAKAKLEEEAGEEGEGDDM